MIKISIGMFAYNEAARIATTIRAVFSQTLIADPPPQVACVEVVIVPNGCRDKTAEVARATIAECLEGLSDSAKHRVVARVEELSQPGKSNAWNIYTHTLSDQSADLLLYLDSDIEFNHEGCFAMLLEKLRANTEASCAVGKPMKDVAFKPRKSWLDRLSLLASSASDAGPPAIAGSMYMVRGPVIREVWMPVGLLTEDGFVRAMLITDLFTKDQQYHRIVRDDRACQIFEAVRSPRGVFKHSKRLLVGARINACIYDKLWQQPPGEAGSFARREAERDPQWLKSLVQESIAGKGWWVMQPGLLTKRIRFLKFKPWGRRLLHLPIALAMFPFDVAVLWAANSAVRRGDFRW
jgi:glycosyltransferase involved in cell wall biosynthesis